MRQPLLLVASVSLFALACQSTSTPRVVEADAAHRDSLMSAVRALEGRWEGVDPEGQPVFSEFKVSSAASAVRELMFPGTPHEMTNMYTLDGNSLVMTHYCAGGNQPRMRAAGIEGGRIVFQTDGVSDLKPSDEYYMGAMTLVLVDADHIEQHWRSIADGQPAGEMVFELARVK